MFVGFRGNAAGMPWVLIALCRVFKECWRPSKRNRALEDSLKECRRSAFVVVRVPAADAPVGEDPFVVDTGFHSQVLAALRIFIFRGLFEGQL